MATISRSTIADEAALYVSFGCKVLFLSEGTKLPITGSHGWKDATDDAGQIESSSRRHPRANIGIATGRPSGFLILDFDPRNSGFASARALKAQGYIFEVCPISKTANDGRHFWYKLETGERFPSSTGRLGPGIDVKGDGGYIVAPPSWVGPTDAGPGGQYEWIVHPSAVRPSPLPTWLRDKLIRKSELPRSAIPTQLSNADMQRRLDGLARAVVRARVGQRNRVLNWAAFRGGELVRTGAVSAGELGEILTAAAAAAGLDQREIRRTIESALSAALGGHA